MDEVTPFVVDLCPHFRGVLMLNGNDNPNIKEELMEPLIQGLLLASSVLVPENLLLCLNFSFILY